MIPATPLLIINADNDHYFCEGGRGAEQMTVDAMCAYIDEIAAGGKVSHIFFCTQGQRSSFNSSACEPIWDGPEAPDERNRRWQRNAKLCFERGIDPYKIWIERSREVGISPWISMRMNDVHLVTTRNAFRVTDFWRDHPELRRDPVNDPYQAGPGWGAFAFDYAHREVRDYHFAIFKELVDRFSPDGIELDWMRFPFLLRPGREKEDSHFITEFMRECRAYTNAVSQKLGRPFYLSVRVPPRLSSAIGFGMDPVRWAAEGLIDLLVPTNFIQAYDFRMDFREWADKIGEANPAVRVIPGGANMCGCASYEGAVPLAAEIWKGWCDVMFSKGAEGVYLFNADYLARPVKTKIYNEGIGKMSASRGHRRYLASFDDCAAGENADLGLRCPFQTSEGKEIVIPVGTAETAEKVYVTAAFSDRLAEPPVPLLNGCAPLASPVELEDMNPYCAKFAKTAFRWEFAKSSVISGDNIVAFPPDTKAPTHIQTVWCEIELR